MVTGAAKGIGRAIVRRLAMEGTHVVAGDIDADSLRTTSDALAAVDAEVLAVCGDLSRDEAIDILFDRALERFGTVDILVNNAADLQRRSLLEEHGELLDLQLSTNVRSPYLCSQRAATIMRDRGGGSIVHISSVGAERAHHRGLPYDVTKGAINSMTRAMAVDLGRYGIRVNAVAPGVTRTHRWPAPPDTPEYQAVAEKIPLRRPGTGDDIASMVAFLASDEACYVTGQVMHVDGGITAQLSPPGTDTL